MSYESDPVEDEEDALNDNETVEIQDVKVKTETDKAILCLIEGEEVWIPKSVLGDDSEVYAFDTEGTLVIARWLAEQKNLA